MALTKRQREIYDFIDGFVKKKGYSPSFEEIGQGMGLNSLATVHKHVSNLEQKGLLRRDYNRSRSIDVLPIRQPRSKVQNVGTEMLLGQSGALPLLGRIAAGRPVETLQNPEMNSLNDITRSKDVFVLEVSGESMQDEHIVNGDYVMVERTKVARNGDIVVALVDGSDTTLMRFFHEGERIRLQPSNTEMPPIVVPSAAVQIEGRLIGVLRKY